MNSTRNRKRSFVVGVAVTGMLLMTSTTHAWLTINNNKYAAQDESAYGCTLDMYAQDGNVVTTNKWNCAIAKIKLIAQFLVDWPKGSTPTITAGNRSDGSIFTAWLNLGAIDGPRKMAIGFYDATQNYTSTPPKAQITYSTTVGQEEGALTFNGGTGGIRAYNPQDNRFDLLGWKQVDVGWNGEPFDQACQYRILTSDGHVLWFGQVSSGGGAIVASYPISNTGEWMARISIGSSSKQTYEVIDALNGAVQSPVLSYGNGNVMGMEELCLPRFGL